MDSYKVSWTQVQECLEIGRTVAGRVLAHNRRGGIMKDVRNMDFDKEVEQVEQGNCPFCGKAIHPNLEFRDTLSLKEYRISGLCQKCQDKTFDG